MSQASSPAVQYQESSFLLCSNGLIHLPQPLKIVALIMNQDFNPGCYSCSKAVLYMRTLKGKAYSFPQDMGYSFQICFSACFSGIQETDAQGSNMDVEFHLV